jgi:hypothetical protein
LFKIVLKLKKGYSTSFLSEGCENRAVYKDDKGLLYLAKRIKGEIELFEVSLEDLMHTTKKNSKVLRAVLGCSAKDENW